MRQDKREIILKEIEQWRQGRLLPEHYCDFLANLYIDREEAQPKNRVFSKLKHGTTNMNSWLLGFVIISLICILGFYFSVFPLAMQIGSTAILAVLCYVLAWRFRKRNYSAWAHAAAIAGSLILLVLGAVVIFLQGADRGVWLPLLIGICSLSWCLVGYWLSLGILYYCGFIGFIFIYAGLFMHWWPTASWGVIQMLWLPLSVIMLWVCRISYLRKKRLRSVYFAVSVTMWFMPEAQMLLLHQHFSNTFILLLLSKAVILLALLFVFRKKWIAWVS